MSQTNDLNTASATALGSLTQDGTTPIVEAPDAELVQRAQGGDTAAFDELVTRYRGRIYAMTYHLIHNEADALDLSQDIFVKAWRALPRFEARSGFYTWLYRIGHNVCYDYLRAKKIESAGEFDDSNQILHADPAARTAAPTTLPNEEISGKELKVEVMAAINQLSYREIADITGATLGTVMSRLFYARKKLQTLLQGAYQRCIED
jgi:RNA polymerase sigma-70 factor, ECF subfamily